MTKRLINKGIEYYIDDKVAFAGSVFPKNDLKKIFDFAFNMTFGKIGEHRGYRSGGQYSRKNGELFANCFQGKLAEFALYYFLKDNIEITEPDLSTWELGKWDDSDFIINDKKVSVKSAAYFSNLLLLETKDWKIDGTYLPNDMKYDFHILVRIFPDIKSILRRERLFFSNETEKEKLEKLILSQLFKFDIPGYITDKQLIEVIENKYILPQNSLLNGTVKMDAENYYCQAGSLQKMNILLEFLLK